MKKIRNYIRIGNEVEIKPELINWYVNHLTWCHGRTVPNDASYSLNEKEIRSEDFKSVYAILHYHLTKKQLYGKVVGYGAEDDRTDWKRLNLKVEVKYILPTGIFKSTTFMSEKDVWRIKK